jgi:hypothetical protein
MRTLNAYHGDTKFKAALLAEVAKHVKADMLVKGTYGVENGTFKGCSVGCSIHSLNLLSGKRMDYRDHRALANELGIPLSLAWLQDMIFEGLPEKESQKWPGRFYRAITPGADLSMVHVDLMIALQRRNLKRPEVKANEQVRTAMDGVLRVLLDWRKNGKPNESAAWSARSAAWSAASADFKWTANTLLKLMRAVKPSTTGGRAK